MAQGDYLIQNQSFPSFRSDLNSTLEAINTSNSGTSRPSSAVAGTVWLDVTNATNPTLKFYDGADDISLAQFDYSANTVNWLDSVVSGGDVVDDTTPQLGGDLDVNGNSIVSVSNGNITFTPDGTGKVIIDGLSHPTADGTAGQFMKTDGSGNLSFDTVDLTNLSATNLTSGTVPIARLGTSGTKDATTFLRGDNTFAEVGGGEWTKILHTTASGVSEVAFNSTYLTSTYQDYKIVFSNVHAVNDNNYFVSYYSSDNGSNFKTMDEFTRLYKDDGSVFSRNSTSNGFIQLHGNESIGNDAGLNISGHIEIFDPSSTDNRKFVSGRSGANIGDATFAFFHNTIGAMTQDTDAINYIKLQWNSGNIATGEFTLYGRKIT